MPNKVFVYGTLRNSNPETKPGFVTYGYVKAKMYNLGRFPGAILDDASKIKGEIYEVSDNDLVSWDRYEGYMSDSPENSLYIRKKVKVMNSSGEEIDEAWIYLFNRPINDDKIIESGDWFSRA